LERTKGKNVSATKAERRNKYRKTEAQKQQCKKKGLGR